MFWNYEKLLKYNTIIRELKHVLILIIGNLEICYIHIHS